MTTGPVPFDPAAERPPWGWAALAAGAILGLYVMTLAPTTALWDASEYITTAHILGIPHPPGNPLFVVVGRVWSLLLAPLGLPVAVRINLLAAVTSAGAAFFYFLVAYRLMGSWTGSRAVRRVGAAVSVVLGGTAYTVWNQSTVNEKVYTLSVLVIAATVWLVLRWRDRRHEPGSERLLLAALYLLVLGSTNHLMSVLPAPALALFVLATAPAVLLRPGVWARAVPLVLLGLSFNLFLPVRAAQDPVINEGDPTCDTAAGALVSVWTNGAAGCEDLSFNLSRSQYQKPPVTRRMAPLGHQLLNWYQYFDWQWARGLDPSELPGGPRTPVTGLFLLLGGFGLVALGRHDRGGLLLVGTLAAILTVGLVYYLNFRYGYSLAPEVTNRGLHEVRERDYFFIAGFGLWGVLAGMGLTRAWVVLASLGGSRRSGGEAGSESAAGTAAAGDAGTASAGDAGVPAGAGAPGPSRRRLAQAAPLLLVTFIPLVLNWSWASRSGDWAARDWAWDLLVSAEPYAILFTNGDNDTFPLWYLQEVEGVRRDVTVVVGQYLFTDWYPRQIQEGTTPDRQRAYDPEGPGSLFPDVAAPTRPVVTWSPERMDAVAPGRLGSDQTVTFPELALTFPEGMSLSRGDQIALRMIVESYDERPIYFTSAAGMMSDLGMDRFAVREGLLHRLDVRPVGEAERPGVVRGSPEYGAEWYDVERSLRLWTDAYRFRGLRDRDVWFDRATLNIPWHFFALALQLSDAVRRAGGDEARAEALAEEAEAFRVTASGGRRGTPVLPAETAAGG